MVPKLATLFSMVSLFLISYVINCRNLVDSVMLFTCTTLNLSFILVFSKAVAISFQFLAQFPVKWPQERQQILLNPLFFKRYFCSLYLPSKIELIRSSAFFRSTTQSKIQPLYDHIKSPIGKLQVFTLNPYFSISLFQKNDCYCLSFIYRVSMRRMRSTSSSNRTKDLENLSTCEDVDCRYGSFLDRNEPSIDLTFIDESFSLVLAQSSSLSFCPLFVILIIFESYKSASIYSDLAKLESISMKFLLVSFRLQLFFSYSAIISLETKSPWLHFEMAVKTQAPWVLGRGLQGFILADLNELQLLESSYQQLNVSA